VRKVAAILLGAALLAASAQAEDRDYCPDRPGLGTPACTMSPGKTSLEIGLGDWTHDKDNQQISNEYRLGDALLRHGIAEHAEVQVGWTAFGFAREKDIATGEVDRSSGVGDLTIAVRRNLSNPDGSGFSFAIMPYVSLPVGKQPIGAGDWGAGVLAPMSYEVSDSFSLVATTQVDAAVDEDGNGRHFAFDEVLGASAKLNDKLTFTAEYELLADRDPEGHRVQHISGLSLAWQPTDDLQLDVGTNIGLDTDAPDSEVYFGVSRRF